MGADIFGAVSQQFRRSFGAVSQQFRRSFGAVSAQFRRSFAAVSAQFRGSFGAASQQFRQRLGIMRDGTAVAKATSFHRRCPPSTFYRRQRLGKTRDGTAVAKATSFHRQSPPSASRCRGGYPPEPPETENRVFSPTTPPNIIFRKASFRRIHPPSLLTSGPRGATTSRPA